MKLCYFEKPGQFGFGIGSKTYPTRASNASKAFFTIEFINCKIFHFRNNCAIKNHIKDIPIINYTASTIAEFQVKTSILKLKKEYFWKVRNQCNQGT